MNPARVFGPAVVSGYFATPNAGKNHVVSIISNLIALSTGKAHFASI